MFVGDKGKILAEFRGEKPRIIPEKKMREFQATEKQAQAATEPARAGAGGVVGGGVQGRSAHLRRFPAGRADLGRV